MIYARDCLKLWVWKPVTAKAGDKLPVSIYIHGGGLQFSAAANNDFSDCAFYLEAGAQLSDLPQGWDKNRTSCMSFAELRSNSLLFSSAVNVAYRLGAFGFMASEALTAEGQHANAALLDMRMAFEWVQANINQ